MHVLTTTYLMAESRESSSTMASRPFSRGVLILQMIMLAAPGMGSGAAQLITPLCEK